MKNVSRKQMITLIVLVIILILVIAVQYFYRPVLEKKSGLEEKVDSMSLVYEDMKMLATFYDIDSISYKEEKELLAQKRSELLPLMKPSQQDNMLTEILVGSGLFVESSVISEIERKTVQVDCSISKESAKDEDIDAYSVLSMYPLGARIVSDTDSSVILEYDTGEYTREISYKIRGKYASLIDFLNKVYDKKSIEVSHFVFNSGDLSAIRKENAAQTVDEEVYDDEGNLIEIITKEVEKPVEAVIEDTVYTAEIGLKVYMYDRDFDLKSRTD